MSSGGAAYGEQETFPAPETHPTWPVSPYGVSKRSGELYCHFFQAEYGLPFVAFRYANVYGPRQDPHGEAGVVAIFSGKMLRGEPVTVNGDGKQTRDYVFVGDVARMSLLALERDATGPVNIGTGVETDVNALAADAARGRRAAAPRSGTGPAKAGEQRRSVVDIRRAAEVFGWRPRGARCATASHARSSSSGRAPAGSSGWLSAASRRNPFVRSIALVLAVVRRVRVRAALIGGFALPFHGVQRATGDVDFLLDVEGSDALHDALVAAGARCLHRSEDAANYSANRGLAAVDFLYARRERALEMLRRARPMLLRGARLRVPVVDAEALIGLKLQALVNAPARRAQDQADIAALFAAKSDSLNTDLLRDYYRLFEREPDLDQLLAEVKNR